MRGLRINPSELQPGVVVEIDDSRHRARPSGRGAVTAPGRTRLARFARWSTDGTARFFVEVIDHERGRGTGIYAKAARAVDLDMVLRIVPPTVSGP